MNNNVGTTLVITRKVPMNNDRFNYWGFILFLIIACMLGSFQSVGQKERWDKTIDLEGKWKFNIGDKAAWSDTYFNDQSWESIYVPSKWEDEGFNGYNGFAWYRTSFDGRELGSNNASFTLLLGYIDDADEVYINGKKIGSSGGFPPKYHTAYNAFRKYPIPSEVLNFTGRNVIAVRVYDAEIEGGIVSGDVGIYVNRDDQGLTYNLRGMWEFKPTWRFSRNSFNPADADVAALTTSKDGWESISVPNTWESQGFDDYDGTAWYRKKFTITKDITGQDLVLLLGKIDDSDKTYLNGKLVGTMVNRWDQLRSYFLPAGLLKVGENTILIMVDDPQGLGGIYEGPVGLMRQTEFTRFMRWR